MRWTPGRSVVALWKRLQTLPIGDCDCACGDGEDVVNTLRNGHGVPASTVGIDGDFYIDVDSSEMYGPKGGIGGANPGEWVFAGSPVSLRGADGADGATSDIGASLEITTLGGGALDLGEWPDRITTIILNYDGDGTTSYTLAAPTDTTRSSWFVVINWDRTGTNTINGTAVAPYVGSTPGVELWVYDASEGGEWIPAAVTNSTGTSSGTCTPEMFGAVGDGTTNDTTAIAAALTAISAGTYRTLVLGAKTYLVTGLTVPAGAAIIGQGANQSILKTATNAALLSINGEGCVIANLQLLGNSSGASQDLLKCGSAGVSDSGFRDLQITNVAFVNAGNAGFFYASNPGPDTANNYKGPQLVNCRAYGCAYGYYCGNRGEYVNFDGCHAERCTSYGIVVAAGNTTLVGCHFTKNTNGINIEGAGISNDSHSSAVGCKFNHNDTIGIRYNAFNGWRFVGCEIYAGGLGSITIPSGVGGLYFVGCQLDIQQIVMVADAYARFDDCQFALSYSLTLAGVDTGARLEFYNCRQTSSWPLSTKGPIPAVIQAFMQQTHTFASDANVTLSAKVSSCEELILATGSLASDGKKVTISYPPDATRRKYVYNGTSYSVDVAWDSGTAVTMAAGTRILLGADGTNARQVL